MLLLSAEIAQFSFLDTNFLTAFTFFSTNFQIKGLKPERSPMSFERVLLVCLVTKKQDSSDKACVISHLVSGQFASQKV